MGVGGGREGRRREGKTFLPVLNNDRRDWIFEETRQENLLNNSDYEQGLWIAANRGSLKLDSDRKVVIWFRE